MNELKLIKLIDELVRKYDDEFPINNSLEMMKVLNHVMIYHIEKQSLSLKVLYTELKVSELCARSNLKRMETNGWLTIEKLKNDSRVRIIKPTNKLVYSYKNFYKRLINNKEVFSEFL